MTVSSIRRQRDRAENVALFKLIHPELVEYLEKKVAEVDTSGSSFDFPQAMLTAIGTYGSLTDRQREAVERIMARDVERARPRQAPSLLDATTIQAAFDRSIRAAEADGEGIKWLRIRAEGLTFSPATRFPGTIYVKEGQTYLGKIVEGKFHRTRECTDEQTAKVAEVAKDPAAAARAYGLRTGSCSICGRELTNADSRARGIGPICAGRMGL